MAAYGSSPRVRGTLPDQRSGQQAGRFIPACAGNSGGGARAPARPAVHPRVCGELGPHPHRRRRRHRFIPACAGNSRSWTATGWWSAVHPRVCGELDASILPGWMLGGSSPRVRGTRRRLRAGVDWRSVHPRVCGELRVLDAALRGGDGSSPRVRGTPTSESLRGIPVRFIPACAGNSGPPAPQRRAPAVHPRVCGELGIARGRAGGVDGSSPRVRGTHRQDVLREQELRFIPACAGNSGASCGEAWRKSVHPRVCGELTSWPRRAPVASGSSPRVRGTHIAAAPFAVRQRFIPACAGNSQ